MTELVTVSIFVMDGKVVKEVSKKMKVKNLIVSAQVLSKKMLFIKCIQLEREKKVFTVELLYFIKSAPAL